MIRALTILFLLIIIGCDSKTEQNGNSKESISTQKIEIKDKNKSKNSFTLETIDGKVLHLSEVENGFEFKEFKNKAIFLVLFGYRCPPCLREIPALIELNKKHNDLEVVAIEVQGYDNSELKEFAKRKEIDYTLISADNHMSFIRDIQAKAKWGGSIPFLIGLNKKGKVVIIHVGGVSKKELEGAYLDLIKD